VSLHSLSLPRKNRGDRASGRLLAQGDARPPSCTRRRARDVGVMRDEWLPFDPTTGSESHARRVGKSSTLETSLTVEREA